MLKKLFITMIVLSALVLSVTAIPAFIPTSTTEPMQTPGNMSITTDSPPEIAIQNITITEVTPVPTATSIPTLASMANARELGTGTLYPNYKVAEIVMNTGDGMGALYIQDLCHHNLISKEFTVQEVKNLKNIQFTNANLVSKEFTELFDKVGNVTTYELDPSGQWDKRMKPGFYVVILLDGNNGQPEYAVVQIKENYRNDIIFIGHAVSMGDGKTQVVSSPTCPQVTTFSLERFLDSIYWFKVKNTDNVPKWINVQYTVQYQKEVKCEPQDPVECRGKYCVQVHHPKPQKCYEDATLIKEMYLPQYAKIGTSMHVGFIDYDTKHKDSKLVDVKVVSCKDVKHDQPIQKEPV